jgi:prophage tail gpP-like protein
MGLNDLTNPHVGEMTIRVTSGAHGAEFQRFKAYTCKENFLEASSTFSFTLDQKELSSTDAALLVPGATVDVMIDGNAQMRGIIDEPAGTFSRDEGNVATITGRDWLSVAVDNQIDPQVRFVPSMSLLDLIVTAYSTIDPNITVVADSIANRNVITGRIYGERTSKKGKPIKSIVLGEEKPYHNEGLFAFTSRVAQRFGLWIRPYVDGSTIVLAGPDFTQGPRYGICHALDSRSEQNNVEKGHFAPNRRDQPSIIYASGFGGGGDFPKSRLRAGIVNPVVNADNSKIISAYSDVPLIGVDAITAAFAPLVESVARPAFLYDRESHTQEQLEAYLRRELSLRMRRALSARYEIMGHKLNGQPIAVDTIVAVLDQQPIANWNGPLWVLGRDFSKTPNGGARTNLELILPGSLQF